MQQGRLTSEFGPLRALYKGSGQGDGAYPKLLPGDEFKVEFVQL